MSDKPAHSPEPTIVDVRHASGGIVALLDTGELVRLFLVRAADLAALPDDHELIGLSVAAAQWLAGTRGALLVPEGDAAG